MIRTTTPTHTFTLPFDPAECDELRITYEQNGRIIIEKGLQDATIDSVKKTVSIILAQEETAAFAVGLPVHLQLKCMVGTTVMASSIYTLSVSNVLSDELMGV